MERVLSPKDLGQAIGASESSLKRWVDSGRIRAAKTPGGHRRIPLAEAIRFIRETRSLVVQPEFLGLPDLGAVTSGLPASGDEARHLRGYLERGEEAAARGLVLLLFLNGRSVAEIIDGPLQQAMEELGELWRDREDGIFLEHRSTEICQHALHQLSSHVEVRPGAPAAVGCAPRRDVYRMSSLATSVVLTDAGLAATNLGADTPLDTLALAVERLQAKVAWLSVSMAEDPRGLADEVVALVDRLRDRGCVLIVGGRERDLLSLPSSDHLQVLGSMGELVAFLRGRGLLEGTGGSSNGA